MPAMANKQPPFSISYAVAILVALLAIRVAVNNWLTKAPLTKENFPMAEELDIREVPIIYYDNLTHLTDFIQDFVVLRSSKPFQIDELEELFGMENVRAKLVDPDCRRESTICLPCFKTPYSKEGVAYTTMSAVLKQNSGMYASFAKVSNEAATKMWKLMGANFAVSNTSLEHAFISNLNEPMITAQYHAASTLLSMSVQLAGRKTWVFIDRYEYISKWGAIPAAGVLLPTRSPKGKLTAYVYTSEPGDLFFFPASYAHTVYTHAGPNLMINYRKVTLESVIGQPLTFLQGLTFAIGNRLVELVNGTLKKRHPDDNAPLLQPELLFNIVAYKKIENSCEANNGEALPVDSQLVKVIHEFADKYPGGRRNVN